jgi:hypothetical protein
MMLPIPERKGMPNRTLAFNSLEDHILTRLAASNKIGGEVKTNPYPARVKGGKFKTGSRRKQPSQNIL